MELTNIRQSEKAAVSSRKGLSSITNQYKRFACKHFNQCEFTEAQTADMCVLILLSVHPSDLN